MLYLSYRTPVYNSIYLFKQLNDNQITYLQLRVISMVTILLNAIWLHSYNLTYAVGLCVCVTWGV